ncbi:hypothetical protein Lal_00034637 [Lupinus albus]|uniref:Uncharacterized protein n=1 Tax=Lupinus albus TaxID=3870 RepID=A0A6A4QS97_LUPAL|nr:hypothetical protein Lalb_Chr03g0028221 [Lupinus albus]KAF1896936.1 hypothetical protein Lal_00034637 [Lupinus albus]
MYNPDKDTTSISLSTLLCHEDTSFLFSEDIDNENIGLHSLNSWLILEHIMTTSFDYLYYFACILSPHCPPQPIISQAQQYILAIAKDVDFMDEGSSPIFIAMAATLMAIYDDGLTREIMDRHIRPISSWGNQDSEHMFFYYKLVQEKVTEKERKNWDNPTSSLTCQWNNTYAVDYSSVTYISGTQFSFDNKENCPP